MNKPVSERAKLYLKNRPVFFDDSHLERIGALFYNPSDSCGMRALQSFFHDLFEVLWFRTRIIFVIDAGILPRSIWKNK